MHAEGGEEGDGEGEGEEKEDGGAEDGEGGAKGEPEEHGERGGGGRAERRAAVVEDERLRVQPRVQRASPPPGRLRRRVHLLKKKCFVIS